MEKNIIQVFKEIFRGVKKNNSNEKIHSEKDFKILNFSKDINKNISTIKSYLGESVDVEVRHFEISTFPSITAAVIYVDTLIDKTSLESSILTPLIHNIGLKTIEERKYLSSNIDKIIESTLVNSKISTIEDINTALDEILSGKGLVVIHNHAKAVAISVSKSEAKEYTEPKTERVIKGPQQGFVEDINANISMIRKRLKNPNLIVRELVIGRESRSVIRVVYIDNIVQTSIVDELFKRLERIDVDGIMGSASIEEYISDAPTNLFQTTFFTERPDKAQAMLLEGRIAIICDGSPFIVIVPTIVSDFFISSDDYYLNPYVASFSRFISYLSAFLLVFLPSTYIAITTFHQEMLPTELALRIAGTRSGVPLPVFLETLLMELAFEALREAGVKLPSHVGQAVSIVGALIIGQAAVEAGLVSSIVVIIVAITAISSFTMPYTNFSTSLRLVRFFMMVLGATLGIYGIMTGALLLIFNLVSLTSFGVPFMVPFAPLRLEEFKDWVARFPQWSITKRSSVIVKKNLLKKNENLKPEKNN